MNDAGHPQRCGDKLHSAGRSDKFLAKKAFALGWWPKRSLNQIELAFKLLLNLFGTRQKLVSAVNANIIDN
jgi:hypothetical protein